MDEQINYRGQLWIWALIYSSCVQIYYTSYLHLVNFLQQGFSPLPPHKNSNYIGFLGLELINKSEHAFSIDKLHGFANESWKLGIRDYDISKRTYKSSHDINTVHQKNRINGNITKIRLNKYTNSNQFPKICIVYQRNREIKEPWNGNGQAYPTKNTEPRKLN